MAGPSDQWVSQYGPFLSDAGPAMSAAPPLMSVAPPQPMPPPPPPAEAPPQELPPAGPPRELAPQPAPQQDGPAITTGGGQVLQANPADVRIQQVGGGGVTPAHEASMVGPQARAHMAAAIQAPVPVAEAHAGRAQAFADQQQEFFAQQAQEAVERKAAMEAAQAKRSAELQNIEADYRGTVQQLGEQHLDSNRWWANKSTGDKISTGIMAFLGGLGALGTGGPNLAWEAIKREMESDVEAQKFDYQTKLDQAKGAQNSFALAMDRYGSEDAAENMARVAALDFVKAKADQFAAQWKGTEAQTAAEELKAKATADQEKYNAQALKYVPAAVSAPRFEVTLRGQKLPGTVTADKANDLVVNHVVKPAETIDHTLVQGGVQAAVKRIEQAGKKGEQEKDRRALWVPTSSTGKGYFAPTEKEAVDHRTAQDQSQQIIDLVDRVSTLRDKLGYSGRLNDKNPLVPSSPDAEEIRTLAKKMLGAINRGEKFGSLDKGAQGILEEMIGDPLAFREGPQAAKLAAIKNEALESRRRLEMSATGEKPPNVPDGTITQEW